MVYPAEPAKPGLARPGPDDIYLTRPLVLAAVLFVAGHRIQGATPAMPASGLLKQEGLPHD